MTLCKPRVIVPTNLFQSCTASFPWSALLILGFLFFFLLSGPPANRPLFFHMVSQLVQLFSTFLVLAAKSFELKFMIFLFLY